MSNASIRSRIINRISQIDDEAFLKEVEEFIQNLENAVEDPFVFNVEMKEGIEKSLNDIKDGNVSSLEEVMKRSKKWLIALEK
jgi:hypothetical protein